MKPTRLFLITLFLTFSHLLLNAPAQEYTKWSLLEGAVARLGKGTITGNIAFSPDSTRLAVASSIGIWIYDVRPGERKPLDLLTGHTEKVLSVTYSPDGTTIFSGGGDKTARLWDVGAGQQKSILNLDTAWVIAFAYSPDGTTIATGWKDSTGHLWDTHWRAHNNLHRTYRRCLFCSVFSGWHDTR